jgi:basic amino acid/polyamine antiporter, APA family
MAGRGGRPPHLGKMANIGYYQGIQHEGSMTGTTTALKAKLTTFDTSMIVVSLVIGIGIFRTPALVATHTGSVTLFFAAWILGGVISLMGALTFAEIGSRYPQPGAFYKVVAEHYHPSVAFMLNYTNVTMVNGVGGAAVGMIGAEYLVNVLFSPEARTPLATQCTAAVLTVFLLALNYMGIKTGARVQNILTILKLVMVVFLIGAAVGAGNQAASVASVQSPDASFLLALGIGLISVFYTYGGYQQTINFGADVQNAPRNMPRAIFAGIAIIVTLYLLVNACYVYVLGMQGVASSQLVAGELARVLLGDKGQAVISVAIFVSAMGFLNVTLMTIPRAYYAMAADGTLPRRFMQVNPRTQSQEFTLLFFGGIIVVSIFLLGTFERLMNYVMLFDTVNIAIVASTIFILRKKNTGESASPYRVPLYPLLPILFILTLLAVTVNVVLSQPGSVWVGLLFFLGGYPLYWILRKLNRPKT